MTALSVVGSALKGAFGLAKGTAKAAGRALLGTADAAGLSKVKRLDPLRRGASYYLSRGLIETVAGGAQVGARAAILGVRGFNALATRPVPAGMRMDSNIFGRVPRPWFVASLAFTALVGGASAANQLTAASSVEFAPRTDPTMLDNYDMPYYKMRLREREMPMLMQDATHNYSKMGATGDLAIALHKNRHG
jgi:hypothetical protein